MVKTLNLEVKNKLIALIIIFVILFSLLFFMSGYKIVNFPLELDYGEGIVVNQALRLSQGLEIYKPLDYPPYIQVCYPPLYLWVLSRLPISAPDNLYISGRAVSFFSSLGIAFLFFLLILHFTKSAFTGVVAAGLYLSSSYIMKWSMYARVDMFGIFWTFLGLYLYVLFKHKRSLLKGIYIIPLVLGIYTKHSLFAIPLVILTDVIADKDRRGLLYYLVFTFITAAVFLLTNLATGGYFYRHIVTYTVLPWTLANLEILVRQFIAAHPFYMVFLLLFFQKPSGLFLKYKLASYYIIFSFFELLLSGREGININFSLNLVMALTIAACLMLFEVLGKDFTLKQGINNSPDDKDKNFKRLALSLVVMQFAYSFINSSFSPQHFNRYSKARQESTEFMNKHIKSMPGKMLTEFPQWALIHEKEYYYDSFAMSMLAFGGRWDQTILLKEIENKEFSTIILGFDVGKPVYSVRFTEEMLKAIDDNYHAAVISATGEYLYFPRGAAPGVD